MRSRSAFFQLMAAGLALLPADANAHLGYSCTRTIESSDGRFVLVLLQSVQERALRRDIDDYDPQFDGLLTQEELDDWHERVEREKNIEAKYSQSGLYRNDGSDELLWPIKSFSSCREVFVANDGQHVVAAKSMGSTCWDDDEDFLVFYSSGKKVAGCDEVPALPCFWMRDLLAHWLNMHFPYDSSSRLNDEAGMFQIETDQEDTVAFDLATGKRIAWWSPWPFYFGMPALAAPLGLWMCRGRLRSSALAKNIRWTGFSLLDIFIVTTLVAATVAIANSAGWFGATCVLVAAVGGLTAKVRSSSARAWIVGGIAALYGGYMLLIVSAFIDSALLDGYTLLGFWLSDEWKLGVPLAILGVVPLAVGWLVGRWCGQRLDKS
jgi:hypothetical protein